MEKILKQKKGITLIALVITIIILLILAGISASMLSGDNGIFQRATDAKKSTEKANEKEQIQAEVLGSYKKGKLEIATVNSNIKNNISGVTTDDAIVFPLIVTYTSTGNQYSVDKNGNVDDYKPADTTWQDNVNYTLDEQTHTLTLVRNDTSRTDIYNGDVIIKAKAIIDGVEYTTKFPNECGSLFSYASRMTSFSMEDIDTSNVTSLASMFLCCSSLQSVDLSGFDSDNVTTMVGMFIECSSLQSIDLSELDTHNVTDMQEMFYNCSSIQVLNLSTFNVDNVSNMSGMFSRVTAKLILTGWKIRGNGVINNTSAGQALAFGGCKSSEIIADNWDVSNVNNFTGSFAGCSSLQTLNISGWNFGTGCVAHGFFAGCTSLSNITGTTEWNLSNFNLNANPFAAICQNCTALGNRLTGGIWNNGTWSNGTFTPST